MERNQEIARQSEYDKMERVQDVKVYRRFKTPLWHTTEEASRAGWDKMIRREST